LRRDVALDVLEALKTFLVQKGIELPDDFRIRARTEQYMSRYASGGVGMEDEVNCPDWDKFLSMGDDDTIAHLDQPSRCRLMVSLGNGVGDYRMEVAKGVVYPKEVEIVDNVPICPGFVAVRIDMVHEDFMELELEVQPDDLTRTLRDT